MDLRENIAAMLEDRCHELGGDSLRIADAVLAMPEIAQALRARNMLIASQMPDLPVNRTVIGGRDE